MREFARKNDYRNPIGVRWNKSRLDAQRKAGEKRAREEARVQMQVLNDFVVALCAIE